MTTKMTRQHFQIIADAVGKIDVRMLVEEHDPLIIRAHIAEEFADALEQTNTLFDRKKFIEACMR